MLHISALTVLYAGKEIVKDVNLNVEENTMTTILGPNGAGKSTILNTIAGLVATYRGNIEFRGNSLRGKRAHEITVMGISLVPERRQLFPELTVFDNLRLGAYNKRARRKLSKLLRMVFEMFPVLEDRIRQKAGSLSGGEQQMLAIGRSIMSDPYLIMLDEPSLGLAPLVVEKIYSALDILRREKGLTVLIAEQVRWGALSRSDKLYVINNGRIVACGTPSQLPINDIWQAYLGASGA
jgi:branched-chain amino acid transport system ATP-binding protein